MPAPKFAGFAGVDMNSKLTIGAEQEETGILIGDMDYSHDDPRVDYFDRWGGEIGFGRNHMPVVTQNVNGEVSDGETGVSTDLMTIAATLVNKDHFAGPESDFNGIDYADSDIYLDTITGTQPRGGARTVSMGYRRPQGFSFTVPTP